MVLAEPAPGGPTVLADEPWGDSAVLFTATGGDPDGRWRAALALHQRMGAAEIVGVVDWIHAYESVLVTFDCAVTEGRTVVAAVRALLAEDAVGRPAPAPQSFELPVVFGGELGPDLPGLAAETGMSVEALVAYVTSGDLVIGCVGGNVSPLMARPGQPFSVRRMTSPRTLVPAGSVALAGDKTCVYPVNAPGGWRIIGRTPVTLYDPDRDPMIRYAAGDHIRLRGVEASEWDAHAGTVLGAEPRAGAGR